MGSRDRPHRESKKKPKAKLVTPKLQPLMEPPQQVELIRKPRKQPVKRNKVPAMQACPQKRGRTFG